MSLEASVWRKYECLDIEEDSLVLDEGFSVVAEDSIETEDVRFVKRWKVEGRVVLILLEN